MGIEQHEVSRIAAMAARLRENVQQVIVGKGDVINLMLVAVLCEGHVLIEDVPGIGKTTLAKSVARSLNCSFRRIQCTPDLLPSDITGTHVFDQRTSEFQFRPGPVMAQIVLADEINRATPRAQSALLEAMEERQVTVEGETRKLARPFMIIATQNPIELEGVFPLPEAQVDRFLMRLRLGYTSQDDDRLMLERFKEENPLEELEPVIEVPELLELQRMVRKVHVTYAVEGYMISLIHATRSHPWVELGASPRAMLSLFRASQALSAIRGRPYVAPDDVKALVSIVLAHRIIAKAQSHLRGHTIQDILKDVLDSVPVPVEEEAEIPGSPRS